MKRKAEDYDEAFLPYKESSFYRNTKKVRYLMSRNNDALFFL